MNVGEGTGVAPSDFADAAPGPCEPMEDEPGIANDLEEDYDEDKYVDSYEDESEDDSEMADESDEEWEPPARPKKRSRVEQEIEIQLWNDSGKLRTALEKDGKKKPNLRISVSQILSETYYHEVTFAAHHLIPGNESLKQCSFWDDLNSGGVAAEIDYNVNAAENGAWLPGHYGYDGWRDYEFKTNYAEAAMINAKAQFHTAHSKYSEWVKDKLDAFQVKNLVKSDTCPDRQQNLKYLKDRLNQLSAQLRGLVTGEPSTWVANVYTSNEAKELIDALRQSPPA